MMEQINYEVTADVQTDEIGEIHHCWGIAAIVNGETLAQFRDVGLDERQIRWLAALLTRAEASILHFQDIIYDFVAAQE